MEVLKVGRRRIANGISLVLCAVLLILTGGLSPVLITLSAEAGSSTQQTLMAVKTSSNKQMDSGVLASAASASSATSAVTATTSHALVPHDGSDCTELDYCTDRLGFEAIRTLHRQLDDDANGNVDVAETDDFLRDELQYENGYERQKGFHRNDKHITVDELWRAWKTSEVHNWTVEETIEWLVTYVELPQYVHTFQQNAVDGTTLPRMALNNGHFLTNVLGIKDGIHKQKIALKAMDVVLFGPPKYHNYVKDVLLVLSLVIAIGGCWFAYVQHKYAQTHVRKMMRDMESLQHAEESLMELQKELDKAKQEQETVAMEKQNLERLLQDEISSSKQYRERSKDSPGSSEADVTRVRQLEEELRHTKDELKRVERNLESRPWAAPSMLQHWLQLTYELELRHHNAKRVAAEQQLAAAKEGCEKLRRKRSSFMGSFRIAHGISLDDIDNRILQAKAALSEVTKDLQERLNRWRQIELLCGFPIVHNPGLKCLEAMLHQSPRNGVGSIARSGSEGTLEDDGPPSLTGSAGSASNIHSSPSYIHSGVSTDGDSLLERSMSGKVLSSHSLLGTSANQTPTNNASHSAADILTDEDGGEEDDDYDTNSISESIKTTPTFTVGDTPPDSSPGTSSSRRMVKSYSQDNTSPPKELTKQKLSASEGCLDSPPEQKNATYDGSSTTNGTTSNIGMRKKISGPLTTAVRSSLSGTVLDEENSTDSNSTVDEEVRKDKTKKKSFLEQLKKKKSKVS